MNNENNVVQLGNTYRRIPTKSITSTVESALSHIGKYDRVRHDGHGTKHMIVWDLLDQVTEINGDMITPRIILYNSYEKECALTVHIGFFRWVCSNGLFSGESTFSTRIVHRVGDICEEKLDELYTGVAAAIKYITSGELVRQIESSTSVVLTREQMIRTVCQLPQISTRSKDRLIKRVINVSDRRLEDQPNNVWTLWNMINEEIRSSSRGNEVQLSERNNGLLNSIKELAA